MACVDDESEPWVEIQLGKLHALHLGRMIQISRGTHLLKGELLSVRHRLMPRRVAVTELTVSWADEQHITVNDGSDTSTILVRLPAEPWITEGDMAPNDPWAAGTG